MEHIVQFGITIDDEEIRRRITEQAVKKAYDDAYREAYNKVAEINNRNARQIYEEIKDIIYKDFMENHKDEVIEEVSKAIVSRAPKYKWFKDAMSEAFTKAIADRWVGEEDGE